MVYNNFKTSDFKSDIITTENAFPLLKSIESQAVEMKKKTLRRSVDCALEANKPK